jgi:4-hydroxybenzoate polyprenyltransferase
MLVARLLRTHQWYKNLVIFIPLIFSNNLFESILFLETVLGFIALCFISSTNYIINDMVDVEKDRLHPEKRKRPIASGVVNRGFAGFMATLLFASSMLISFFLEPLFILWPIMLFISTQIYSMWLKRVPIVDIHMIALNFIIRTTAGSAAIGVVTSPWLFILAFMLALYLALGKRISELKKLGKNAARHKTVFNFYDADLLKSFMLVVMAALISTYCFYTFLARPDGYMMVTIPIAVFLVFRYFYMIRSDSRVGERTELVIKDKQMLIGTTVWVLMSIAILYLIQ